MVVAFAAALLLVVLFSATDRTRQTPVTAAVGPKPIARRGVTAARGGLLARENAAIDRLLRRQPFISSGGPQRREIAITFDDGPGPYTPGLLAQLQRLHVPATFFEVGFTLRYFFRVASAGAADGGGNR